MIEVHDKRDHLLSLKKHEQRDFLAAHPIPAVGARSYITDHRHLGRTASEADLWADFSRPGVLIGPTRPAFQHSVDQALTLATLSAAAHLSGLQRSGSARHHPDRCCSSTAPAGGSPPK